MEKDDKILKKIGKLLSAYGVSEEEKNNFLTDLQNTKDDEEETNETPAENNEMEQKPLENEDAEQPAPEEQEPGMEEQAPAEEKPTDNEPVEQPEGEEVANDSEETPMEEQPMEQPVEEQPQETVFDPKASHEEMQKTIEGLTARLASLEDIVSKLGVEEPEDKTMGASASGNPIDESNESAFDTINRKRVGF